MSNLENEYRLVVVVPGPNNEIVPVNFKMPTSHLEVSEKVTQGLCGELLFNQPEPTVNTNPAMARKVDAANPEYNELFDLIAKDAKQLALEARPIEKKFTPAASEGVLRNATGDLSDPRLNWGKNGMVQTGTNTKQIDPFKL